MAVAVVLYRGAGCGLCERALDVLEPRRRASASRSRCVDIDGDDELERRYRLDLPVVEIDGAARSR